MQFTITIPDSDAGKLDDMLDYENRYSMGIRHYTREQYLQNIFDYGYAHFLSEYQERKECERDPAYARFREREQERQAQEWSRFHEHGDDPLVELDD